MRNQKNLYARVWSWCFKLRQAIRAALGALRNPDCWHYGHHFCEVVEEQMIAKICRLCGMRLIVNLRDLLGCDCGTGVYDELNQYISGVYKSCRETPIMPELRITDVTIDAETTKRGG